MLQVGTDNSVKRARKITLTVSNFQSLSISVNRSSPIILLWPSNEHEVWMTTDNMSVVRTPNNVSYTKPEFSYTVDNALRETRFQVPEDFEGSLYYFCKAHAAMDIHEIHISSKQEPLDVLPSPEPAIVGNSNSTSSSSSPDPFMIAGITLGVLVVCAVIIICLIRRCVCHVYTKIAKTKQANFCPTCDRMEMQHE